MEEIDSQPYSVSSNWDCLGSDLTGLILSYLPIRSIVRASAVCKLWRSVVTKPSFSSRVSAAKKPWFFLFGQNNIFIKKNQTFAFDPEANEWIRFPSNLCPSPCQGESFLGSGGFFFTTTPSYTSRFTYSPILCDSWRETSPLSFCRSNPIVGVFDDDFGLSRFIVIGGVGLIGGLVDIEDRLAVEIYDPKIDTWERCPPLPDDFRSGNSSQRLTSALFKGKVFVFDINSCFVSSFDLKLHSWSELQTLRPPGVMFSFLLACTDQLVLAGLCKSLSGPSFKLWRVDEEMLEFSEVGIMPQNLLNCLFDSDEDDKFASLKCVGLGNSIYVFNEVHHRVYPTCVCEIRRDWSKCNWRKVPDLPEPMNRFHKVTSFCSQIPVHDILGVEEDGVVEET